MRIKKEEKEIKEKKSRSVKVKDSRNIYQENKTAHYKVRQTMLENATRDTSSRRLPKVNMGENNNMGIRRPWNG